MGCDEGVLISDPGFEGMDNFQTANALAKAIQKIGEYDLILMGRAAADWDMGVVPLGVANALGIPVVTVAKAIEKDGDSIKVERVLDDGFQTVKAPLPAVVSVSNEFGEPRYPQLRQIMLAAKKTVEVWSAADIGLSRRRDRRSQPLASARSTLHPQDSKATWRSSRATRPKRRPQTSPRSSAKPS
jgi:electron transfer flavoprotein beta subunit